MEQTILSYRFIMSNIGRLLPDRLLVGTGIVNRQMLTPKLFCYVSASSVANVTGDNTVIVPLCDTVLFDIGAGYDATTGIYTAPEDGYYLINGQIGWSNIDVAHTRGQINIYNGFAGLTSQTEASPAACRSASNNYTQTATQLVKLTSGQTLVMQGFVSGGAKTVGYNGDFFGQWTFLSIMKIA